MYKNAKRQRKCEGRLAAKIARVLANGGVECPENVKDLAGIVATLAGGKDLAARIPSLSDFGIRQVQGQAGAYSREIRGRREQFQFASDAIHSRFGGKAKLRDLSHLGKDWSASVAIPGPENVWVYDHEATDLGAFLERLVSEVAAEMDSEILELLNTFANSGIEDERDAERVREAFRDTEAAIVAECELAEFWRSLPPPGA
jgi:hypothetical protein